jgi:hypothetical protein
MHFAMWLIVTVSINENVRLRNPQVFYEAVEFYDCLG